MPKEGEGEGEGDEYSHGVANAEHLQPRDLIRHLCIGIVLEIFRYPFPVQAEYHGSYATDTNGVVHI